MPIRKIMVVGAGQMGAGIAQVCAQAGFEVVLHDVNDHVLEKSISQMDDKLSKSVAKGKITEQTKINIQSNIKQSTNVADSAACDVVIEAVIEDIAIKTQLFQELDQIIPKHAILASNTSAIPITKLAAVTNRPEKVIGMHFMNPVPVMKLVEIICGLQTSDETYEVIKTLANKLGKTSVKVNDFPGFVSNRILMPMINEAIYTVYEGVSTPEDIDTVMRLGMNHPMGPLTLADHIGLDTCLAVMEVLHEGFGDSKYRPCPLLRQYVSAGWLGKKTGRGFFIYES